MVYAFLKLSCPELPGPRLKAGRFRRPDKLGWRARGAAHFDEFRPIALHFFIFLQPGKNVSKDARRMRVRWRSNPVMHPFPLSPRAHNPSPAKISQVPRDFRLTF